MVVFLNFRELFFAVIVKTAKVMHKRLHFIATNKTGPSLGVRSLSPELISGSRIARNRTLGGRLLVNSIPAASNTLCSAINVELCATKTPGLASGRLMVGSETEEAWAS